jgi:hypothetical protein
MIDRPPARHSARILLAVAVLLLLFAPVVARMPASRGAGVTGTVSRAEALAGR